MFHKVMTKKCEGTSMNRCVCAVPLRVNEWLTWGYLLLNSSAPLNNRLALRAVVNDGVMIHFQRADLTTLFLSSSESRAAVAKQLVVCLEVKGNPNFFFFVLMHVGKTAGCGSFLLFL